MRRGFKAYAERLADQLRSALDVGPHDVLSARKVAQHLNVLVQYPKQLDLDSKDISQLTELDPDSWSGVTVKEAGLISVILNPAHSKRRESHTLMHELAHIILKHLPNRIDIADGGLLLLSDFSKEQEEEADCLSGCLLLPRALLLKLRSEGRSAQEIALAHGVSNELCQWRIRMTGVDYQLKHRSRLSG